jgi:hypothetical protein
MLQEYGHVDVVAEVPYKITAADIVDHMKLAIPHDEMISEGARPSGIERSTQVFGEPYG